jgi:hypothetical protein
MTTVLGCYPYEAAFVRLEQSARITVVRLEPAKGRDKVVGLAGRRGLADFRLRSMHIIVHGRFPNIGLPVNCIAADVLRLKDGILVEHWDVIQDEATKQQSKSGNPTFGDSFPK